VPPDALAVAPDLTTRLRPDAQRRIESIEVFAEIESTNRYLLERAPPPAERARIAIAEFQQAGRGRRGRSWTMPRGSGIALSAAWRFAKIPGCLSALSLGAGAATRRAIFDATALDVGLKWPNDLIVDGGKTGGILVEFDQLDAGCHVVVGVGINVSVAPDVLEAVRGFGGRGRDLAGAVPPGVAVDRDALTLALIERLIELFAGFAASGFAPYRDEWLAAHVLDGAAVELHEADGVSRGTVRGIDADGALLLGGEDGGLRRIVSGDVTVRTPDHARD